VAPGSVIQRGRDKAVRLASAAATNAPPTARKIRATTVTRPWPMLALALVVGILLGRRVG
jgi:hypothetical protein